MTGPRPVGAVKTRLGQSMVEVALILPVVLAMACGMMEFTWMYYNIAALQFATHEGARYGAVGRTNDEVINKVKDSMWGMSVTTVEVSVTTSGGSVVTTSDRTELNRLTVQGRLTYSYLTPLPQIVGGNSRVKELKASSTVTIESGTAR
jgi:Flp pilus assembly protein TadG